MIRIKTLPRPLNGLFNIEKKLSTFQDYLMLPGERVFLKSAQFKKEDEYFCLLFYVVNAINPSLSSTIYLLYSEEDYSIHAHRDSLSYSEVKKIKNSLTLFSEEDFAGAFEYSICRIANSLLCNNLYFFEKEEKSTDVNFRLNFFRSIRSSKKKMKSLKKYETTMRLLKKDQELANNCLYFYKKYIYKNDKGYKFYLIIESICIQASHFPVSISISPFCIANMNVNNFRIKILSIGHINVIMNRAILHVENEDIGIFSKKIEEYFFEGYHYRVAKLIEKTSLLMMRSKIGRFIYEQSLKKEHYEKSEYYLSEKLEDPKYASDFDRFSVGLNEENLIKNYTFADAYTLSNPHDLKKYLINRLPYRGPHRYVIANTDIKINE